MPRDLIPQRESVGSLVDVVDAILDKGLVVNADIMVSLVGVELLGIKIRAALASFETAARYGLEFPSGTNLELPAWQEARVPREICPQCEKRVERSELLSIGCPWCGWLSARSEAPAIEARPGPPTLKEGPR